MPPDMNNVMPFIVAFQPPNAVASQPVAVSFPNLLNTPPGTNLTLMTLDPTKGVMVNYGTGTVSADGTQVIPNVDPDHPGHSYGLVHFDWHGPAQQANDEDLCPDCTPTPDFFATVCPECGDPIDLSSGLAVLRETDLAISGLRGGIAITRISRNLAFRDPVPPFGIGTSHNYAYRLNTK
jgi:hypothetical protein